MRGDLDRDAVQVSLPVARQEQGRLTEGLRRERSRVDGGTARLLPALDHRHPLAEVRGPSGSLLAGRAAPDHHEVEAIGRGHDGRSLARASGVTVGRYSG